jgi:hypothetical protein
VWRRHLAPPVSGFGFWFWVLIGFFRVFRVSVLGFLGFQGF